MTSPFHLQNKLFLVTGASSGIGRQIALSITEMGGRVVITGRDKKRLTETFEALQGKDNKMLIADLLNTEETEALLAALPEIDGVVNSSGTVKPFPVKFLTAEKLAETFDTNYNSQVLLMSRIARLKKLKRNASVVFISSISAIHPHKGGATYSGSKAALESFSKVFALEFYTLGIRSNCIAPAMVKTPMYESAEKQGSKEEMDAHIRTYPLGVGYPADVANAAVFLLSDASRWITGTTLILDGGFSLGGLI
jgi:NAD(P)-dependent dehydrogenase (short-subunit alcohol dehydrogenase family)